MINIHRLGNGHALPSLSLALAVASACVRPALAQEHDPNAPSDGLLPAVQVEGSTGSGAYHTEHVDGAKSSLPLRELPQSVRVITGQVIDDLHASKVDDVLDYVGGVSRQNSFGGLWDNYAIRGMPANDNTGPAMLRNGFSSNRGFNAPNDLAGVERIEFLKGPVASLYGSSEPGGTINVVSKRPLWSASNVLDLSAGSLGARRAAIDSSGPIGQDFAYRLNAAVEGGDSFRDHVSTERQVLAPAFTWKLGRDSVLEYAGEWLRHRAPMDRGVVAVNNQLGAIPRSRFLGEPADGDITIENQTHQLILMQEWTRTWRSRLGLSYRDTSLDGYASEASTLLPSGDLTRLRRYRDYASDDIALQAELQGVVAAGGVEHELLLGVESFRFDSDMRMLRVNPSAARPYAINIYDPVYGQPRPVPGPNTDTLEHQRNSAFYAQDTIRLAPDWRLMAGVRVDSYRQTLLNRLTGVTTQQDLPATSPRAGLTWLPAPQWSVYANAGKSFRLNPGTDAAGDGFEPEEGRALEVGAKWERPDQGLGLTASLFEIRKKNVLTGDPANPGYSIAAGEMRSRGLELEVGGQLTRRWRLDASLQFSDVEVTRDNTLEVGGRVINVPAVSGSLLAVYENALDNGQRWGLGGGMTYVGKRLGQARTQAEANQGVPAFELPAYFTAKLVGYWRLTPTLRLSLDIDNLFDKTYYASSYSRVWVAPGAPRSVTVGLQASF